MPTRRPCHADVEARHDGPCRLPGFAQEMGRVAWLPSRARVKARRVGPEADRHYFDEDDASSARLAAERTFVGVSPHAGGTGRALHGMIRRNGRNDMAAASC